MRTALYILWGLLPLFFFSIAAWAFLEKLADKDRRENPMDFFSQGIFVLVCVLASVAIDQYCLESLVNAVLPDLVPLIFYQALLLPFVLLVGSYLVGPSKKILIGQEPHGAKRRRPK